MPERTLRIFVSSPSDVAPERARVKLVADRLNSELDGRVRLEILRWEDGFYSAATSFQEAIDQAIGNMTATDMVLCILWKRAGLRLNPAIWHRADGSSYESGTVLEFETAIAVSRAHSGVPDCFLFRKSAEVLYRADRANEEMEQHHLLEAVWKRWTESAEGYNTAGYQHFGDTDDFERKLDACLRQWLERLGVVAKGPVWDRALKGSPFRGLAAFELAHAPVFFGREAAIARATDRLRRAPFLLVIGASGSGKSSLLRAGLVPRVTAPGVIADVDVWRTVVIVPSDDPVSALAEALFAEDALGRELKAGDFSDPHLLAELFGAGGKAALAPVRTALARAAAARKEALHYDDARPARLLIAVDQVERLFVEVAPARVDAFARLLRALVEGGLASLVLVLRSDTYGRFQTLDPFLELLESSGATLDLLPPSASELEDIVSRPVAACHPPLAYERDPQGRSLAEILVADAKGGDALPLLQMTLQRLFEAEAARGDGLLRFADYPGMDAAVTRTAEEALAKLDTEALAALPALLTAFVRDVTITPQGALEALTIVPVERSEFERGQPARRALIDEFIALRLLTAEDADGAVRVRPVHEALLRVVPAAVAAIKENAALIRVRRTLEPMVAEWSRAAEERKPDFLATSPALIAGAAQLDERFGPDLAPNMRAFIAQSLAADASRREAEAARQRRILTATAAGLVIALGLAALAGWQWRTAAEQRQIADSQRTRAENTLAAATGTTNGLVFQMAQNLRDRGLPLAVLRDILQSARALQQQLTAVGEVSPRLRNSEAAALCELSLTLGDQGATQDALESAELCNSIAGKVAAEAPANAEWQRQLASSQQILADALRNLGRRDEALATYRKSLTLREGLLTADPANPGLLLEVAASYQRLGGLFAATGQRELALENYRKSLALGEKLAAQDPANSEAQRHLAVSHNNIGDMLVEFARHDEALMAYRDGLAVTQRLAESDPTNTRWKQDLGISYENIGYVLLVTGHADDALTEYGKSLAIREELAASDRGNAKWQRELAAAYSNTGNAFSTAGKRAEAIDYFRKSAAIAASLLAGDPVNPDRQRDLNFAESRLADTLALDGQWEQALAAYRMLLPVREKLAAAEPDNLNRQRELGLGYVRIGLALSLLHRPEDSLLAFMNVVTIFEKLVSKDPANADLQTSLATYYGQVGSLLLSLNRADEAIESARKNLSIAQKLAAANPASGALQLALWTSYNAFGDMLSRLDRAAEARTTYLEGLPILERLASAAPANVDRQTDLAFTLFKLAQVGDDPPGRLRAALAIVQRLDSNGTLPPDKKNWIGILTQALENLPK